MVGDTHIHITETTYDSRPDTWEHIHRVQHYMQGLVAVLVNRAHKHDQSKLFSPEKEAFDIATPKLKGLTYGTPEYKAGLSELGEALEHHYGANPHHPQYFVNGISDMSLIDLMEMLCDWAAARERGKDNDFKKGMAINKERYNIDDQLFGILMNTMERFGLDG